jgi:hypothetical protein
VAIETADAAVKSHCCQVEHQSGSATAFNTHGFKGRFLAVDEGVPNVFTADIETTTACINYSLRDICRTLLSASMGFPETRGTADCFPSWHFTGSIILSCNGLPTADGRSSTLTVDRVG